MVFVFGIFARGVCWQYDSVDVNYCAIFVSWFHWSTLCDLLHLVLYDIMCSGLRTEKFCTFYTADSVSVTCIFYTLSNKVTLFVHSMFGVIKPVWILAGYCPNFIHKWARVRARTHTHTHIYIYKALQQCSTNQSEIIVNKAHSVLANVSERDYMF